MVIISANYEYFIFDFQGSTHIWDIRKEYHYIFIEKKMNWKIMHVEDCAVSFDNGF